MFSVLFLALGAPPEFTVINKTVPGFTVINTTSSVSKPAAPVVAAKTFRSGPVSHAGHDCPKCGYEQRRTPITGYLPNGQHQHTCPVAGCGTVWFH